MKYEIRKPSILEPGIVMTVSRHPRLGVIGASESWPEPGDREGLEPIRFETREAAALELATFNGVWSNGSARIVEVES